MLLSLYSVNYESVQKIECSTNYLSSAPLFFRIIQTSRNIRPAHFTQTIIFETHNLAHRTFWKNACSFLKFFRHQSLCSTSVAVCRVCINPIRPVRPSCLPGQLSLLSILLDYVRVLMGLCYFSTGPCIARHKKSAPSSSITDSLCDTKRESLHNYSYDAHKKHVKFAGSLVAAAANLH